MKVTLESTSEFARVDGLPVRIWKGTTESGISCIAMITAVGCEADEPRQAELEAELVAIETSDREIRHLGPISLN
jgi:hypothetical protein